MVVPALIRGWGVPCLSYNSYLSIRGNYCMMVVSNLASSNFWWGSTDTCVLRLAKYTLEYEAICENLSL